MTARPPVSEMLGHPTVAFTLDQYVHLGRDAQFRVGFLLVAEYGPLLD